MKKIFTWKGFFQSHLFFAIGLGALILISVNLSKAQLKNQGIRSEIAALQNEVETLEQERSQYDELLKVFDTPAFLEAEARRSLGYVKPGEKVIVIEKNAECGIRNTECVGEKRIVRMSNPRKWWVYFFGS